VRRRRLKRPKGQGGHSGSVFYPRLDMFKYTYATEVPSATSPGCEQTASEGVPVRSTNRSPSRPIVVVRQLPAGHSGVAGQTE
jgi:hypothetical protein